MPDQPEAFSRILIDQALKESGWDLFDPHRVRFESSGRDGRADYILLGKNGPLCVLEAKRPDLDPYDAKDQARGYAENVRAPFIILSNGREHWFWNYERADQRDAYRIERLPSPTDLERLRLKKPRETRHDATLYRLYQKASEKIEKDGGTNLRVVLDYELKRDLYRELAKLKSLPQSEQDARREQIAQEHGLKVVDGKIPLPDLRIEYETRDHEQSRVDLELATRDYRGHHLAEKGKAGFSIYAPAEDASRVRAAAQDPHLISEILSL